MRQDMTEGVGQGEEWEENLLRTKTSLITKDQLSISDVSLT